MIYYLLPYFYLIIYKFRPHIAFGASFNNKAALQHNMYSSNSDTRRQEILLLIRQPYKYLLHSLKISNMIYC